jgi:hypothetical protein
MGGYILERELGESENSSCFLLPLVTFFSLGGGYSPPA